MKTGALIGVDKYGNKYFEDTRYFFGKVEQTETSAHITSDGLRLCPAVTIIILSLNVVGTYNIFHMELIGQSVGKSSSRGVVERAVQRPVVYSE